MSVHKTFGIVLHTTPFSETSLIAHIYTADFGRQSYLIRGVRKSGGKHRMALFQPLSMLSMEVSHSARREIQHLREARIHIPCLAIQSDPVKNSVALFMAEILWRSLRTEEPNPPLFQFLTGIIQMLDVSTPAPANLHLYFLIQLSKYIGFWPENNYSHNHCHFELASGRFTAQSPETDKILDQKLSTQLHRLLNLRPDELSSLILNRQDRYALAEALTQYFRYHLEGMGFPKSLSMMKEVFSAGEDS